MDFTASNEAIRKVFWHENFIADVNFLKLNLSSPSNLPLIEELTSISFVCCVFLFIVNLVLENIVLLPIIASKMKKRKLPFESEDLERIYLSSKHELPTINERKALSKVIRIELEDINKWFKVREKNDRTDIKRKRTAESVWRLMLYSSVVGFEAYLLSTDKTLQNCFADFNSCFKKPEFFEPASPFAKHFFVCVQIPLYFHLLISHCLHFFQRVHVDFLEMFSHHLLVLFILGVAYFGNFLAITFIGLCLHDVTDVFLEVSKLANYFEWHSTSLLSFVAVDFVWGFCRLFLFIIKIVVPLFAEDQFFGQIKPAILILICGIFLLNLYWFWLITRLNYKMLWKGVGKKRERALTDLSTDDDMSELDDLDSDFEEFERKKEK
eukprot:snap_masked-scaffold_1-processed-gene-7.21-mRNA-1 protein AED:1.00 eAED:1.00 QI:0/-1/0/0/-1/1/1/0/380